MSTLRVSSINNAAASAGGIAIDSSGGVSGALPAPNRNLLYNGAMQVAQRGTSTASITTAGYYTADRWSYGSSGPLGTYTQSIEADAPTGSGLRNSLKMLCTTAKASPAAGDFAAVVQSLEGQDVQRIAKGTASAQQVTLSFWVKANVTGTYIASLEDVNNTRDVSASYTISASATWERKTITFPADATGAFTNDNGASLRVRFWLAAGSTFTSGTLNTAWAATTNANRAVGQTNLAASTNNYWQVTGVQLEVGPVATSFEFKSYGQELRECQRYYYRVNIASLNAPSRVGFGMATSTTNADIGVFYPVTMRVAATALDTAGTVGCSDGVTSTAVTSLALAGSVQSATLGVIAAAVASGLTQYRPYFLEGRTSATIPYIGFSAEL